MNRKAAITTLSVLALASAAGLLIAGPLDPPAGPVASTYKTLTEVEPRIAINATNTPGDPIGSFSPSLFKITQPGSYYLTGNITGVVGMHGIEISADGVTIDLNGFDVAGVPGMGDFDGITIGTFTNRADICIRNGSVRNWGGDGIDIGSTSALHSRVSDVRASGNAGDGIFAGVTTTVTGCSACSNGGNGFRLVTGSSISGCMASENGLDGILVSDVCEVLANHCMFNGNAGSGAGIHATGRESHIEGNNCYASDRGIDIDDADNFIVKNICHNNATNWSIVAGNVCGPVLDRTAAAGLPIIGDSGASTLGTTDPNANFTY